MLTLSNVVWGGHAFISVVDGIRSYLNLDREYQDTPPPKRPEIDETHKNSLFTKVKEIKEKLQFHEDLKVSFQYFFWKGDITTGRVNGLKGLIISPNIFEKCNEHEIEFDLTWNISLIKHNTIYLMQLATCVCEFVLRTLVINLFFPLSPLKFIPPKVAIITSLALWVLCGTVLPWTAKRMTDRTVIKTCSTEALQAKIESWKQELAKNIAYRNEEGISSMQKNIRCCLYTSEGDDRGSSTLLTSRIKFFQAEIDSRTS